MIKCPWCEQGTLEPTPAVYNDPPTTVYCPECACVFSLQIIPELCPCGEVEP